MKYTRRISAFFFKKKNTLKLNNTDIQSLGIHRLSPRRGEGWKAVRSVHYPYTPSYLYTHHVRSPPRGIYLISLRLRTRMAFVQQREKSLEEKRLHCKLHFIIPIV